MNGGHDLGGEQGLGPINPEAEQQEAVFHEEWERRMFALTMATGMLGQWNIDQSRHARERQHPVDYLRNSYYENWLAGTLKLLQEQGLMDEGSAAKLRVPNSEDALKLLFSGGPTSLDADAEPAYKKGDKVRLKKIHGASHTRAPSYAQGCVGVVDDHYGGHVFADSNALGERRGEHLYSVRFAAKDLWGAEAENSDVLIDLWQPYLETVQG